MRLLVHLFVLLGVCWSQSQLVLATHHNHQHDHDHSKHEPVAASAHGQRYPHAQQPHVYHAPPRAVPFPRVNREIKHKFLRLFHHDNNMDPNQPITNCPEITDELRNSSRLDRELLDQINQLCPCNTFFYSFADRHLNATRTLQRAFVRRIQNIQGRDQKANELLEFAKHELSLHLINKRVWFYALLGTFLEVPDLNGYNLAWAVDATPDLYIPFYVLREATERSSRPLRDTRSEVCETANGVRSSERTLEGREGGGQGRPGGNQGQQGRPAGNQGQQGRPGGNQGQQGRPGGNQGQQGRPAGNQGQQWGAGGNQGQQGRPASNQGQQGRPGRNQGQPVVYEDQIASSGTIQHGQLGNQQGRPSGTLGQPGRPATNIQGHWETSSRQKRTPANFTTTIFFEEKGRRTPPRQNPQNPQQQRPSPGPGPGSGNSNPQCIRYTGTQGATGNENWLWYFREDVMVNEQHWYWHQYYPTNATRHPDRRGEAFYFTHHNIVARYNSERLSNGLERETALDLRQNGNIGSGYDSDLVDMQSGRFWNPRVENAPLTNLDHLNDTDFQLAMSIDALQGLYRLLSEHVSNGILQYNRTTREGQPPTIYPLPIRNPEGFSHLGNTVEASEQLSTSVFHYNDTGVHNLAHVAVGLAADPDFRCRRPTGVMADLSVTMRDPAFYKVHTLVDDLFDQYKRTLPPYQLHDGEWPLVWDGVQITNIETFDLGGGGTRNHISTFWSTKSFPLEQGIDYSVHNGDANANVCHVHLNHSPFTFQLTLDVQNASSRGTVRIFMAPRYNLNGKRFTMNETRRLMFQLDAFPVELRRGRNVITRNSQDSSATKPWSRSLQEMLRDPDNGGQAEYCGCGWPNHLYVPKGTAQGMEFDLFAMVTNLEQDQVQNSAEDLRIPEPCNSPYLFCGVPYRRYPDARPMGYPFDRLPYSVVERQVLKPVNWLEEYVNYVPNMHSSVVRIQHRDTVIN